MSAPHRRVLAVLLLVALAAPAVPALAQPAPQPGAPPVPSPLPAIPAVPPVPSPGPGAPLTLAQAVSMALQQNLQLRQAALQVAVSRAQLAQAQAATWPTVGVTAGYSPVFGITSGPSTLSGTITIPGAGVTSQPFVAQVPTTAGTTPWLVELRLSYPLYTGNALQDQIAIAQASLRAAEAALSALANQIVLQARQAYYAMQLAQGQVAAAQRAVAAAQENVRVTQARVRAGTSPQFDLLQAQVLLAQQQQTLTAQRANVITAQQQLNVVLNQAIVASVAPATPLGLPAPPEDVEALVRQALQTRPELAQVQAQEQAAQAAIDLAAAGLRPNVSLTGGPQIVTSDITTRAPVTWAAGIQMTLTIFDGGVTRAKIEQARQQLAVAQTREAIEQLVRTAYVSMQSSAEQLRSAETALVAAREALRIANVRFQAGVGTQLEVVTAEQNLASADLGVVQAEYTYNLALAQIQQAVGVQVALR